MTTIRILSLDGGGTRAGVLAKALGAIYGPETAGRDIIGHFHYVAGNSGGSIVLTALCCGYRPCDIADFYDDPKTLKEMFSPKWTAAVPLLSWFFGRYSASGKFAALKSRFDRKRHQGEPLASEIPIQDWPKYVGPHVNLIVSAFDYDQERAHFFRSSLDSRARSSAPLHHATLLQAVHASTNAPLPYYDKPAEISGRRYWDGGLAGYNNPVLAAVVEALSNRPQDLERIRVLSIGTGSIVQPLERDGAAPPLGRKNAGIGPLKTLKTAATAIFGDPPDVATFHAYVALRQPLPPYDGRAPLTNVVRLSPFVRPIWDEPRQEWCPAPELSPDEFDALLKMRVDPMKRRDIDLLAKATTLWLADKVPNQPIRMGHRLQCDVGDAWFSDGRKHWESIADH